MFAQAGATRARPSGAARNTQDGARLIAPIATPGIARRRRRAPVSCGAQHASRRAPGFRVALRFARARVAKLIERTPATAKGVALMMAAALMGTGMNAGIRFLANDLHAFEVAFFRCVFGFAVLAPVFFRGGLAPLRTSRFRLHAVRGVVNAAAMLMFFAGVALTPLAKASALAFSGPLFATLLAVVALGEVIRVRRTIALGVGFLGAWIIIRPGVIPVEPGALLVLGAAAVGAVSLILMKVLSRTESSVTMTLYTSVFALPFTCLAAISVWRTPSLAELGVLAIIGALGTGVHLCMAGALKRADISAVVPAEFTRLIWAAIIGYLVFAEVSDALTWVGGAVIFAASSYVAFRARHLKTERRHTPPRQVRAALRVAPPM
jgi:drug/metabolite transporter (DMT)-like permease